MSRPGRGELPPGPRSPGLFQTAYWGSDPVGLFDDCAERYGDTFTLKLGYRGPVVCISDPETIKSVFLGDARRFRAGAAYEVLGPVAGPDSLLLLDEDRHLRMRRLLLPPLHGDALARWSEVVEQAAHALIDTWPVDKPFSLRPSMEAITLAVVMRIVFGIRDPGRSDELRRLLPHMFEISNLLGAHFLFPALQRDLGPWSPWGRFLRRRDRIDRLLYAEIAARREEVRRHGIHDSTRSDVLSLLLAATDEEGNSMSDRELRDSLITMLLAGQETTATALAWAFERLVRHPAELDRLREEVVIGGGNAYLDAVIKETLRVRPVVAQVGRVLGEDTELDGYAIPAGQMIMGLISRVHRSPRLYADPLRFSPQRFIDEAPDSYGWIPFGGGIRRCIGAGLALLEMRGVVATIVRRTRLTPADERAERARVRGITLAPERGGRVVLASRLADH